MNRTHGGRRTPGPGKSLGRPPKPDAKVTIAVCVTPTVAEYLRSVGASAAVEEAVRRSKGFRRWRK